ncbi:MAG TPA: 6,7-dimethyl-8-ribityllumazine synthase [Tepidisphaeraceae bacterium]|jgi:6,7-dimethyl-8-ribityllumazine synthase|nr:6,7-dimethyl-8-ribityllumazine synthase [Tepidisphaeraceae bacterium]
MSTHVPEFTPAALPPGAKFAIVAARFNAYIVDELVAGCVRRFGQMGVDEDRLSLHRVPGAFELPVAAKLLAKTNRYAAIVCLGAVVRGDTPHFDYVAGEAASGIQKVAVEQGLPVIFGVLTTNTEQQALDRIGGSHGHAGERAAEAAAEMVALAADIARGQA